MVFPQKKCNGRPIYFSDGLPFNYGDGLLPKGGDGLVKFYGNGLHFYLLGKWSSVKIVAMVFP